MKIHLVYSLDCNDGYTHIISAHRNEEIANSKVERLRVEEEMREEKYAEWVDADFENDDEARMNMPEMPHDCIYRVCAIEVED